jgi:hypothetical protein
MVLIDPGDLIEQKHPNQVRRENKCKKLCEALENPLEILFILPTLVRLERHDEYICVFTRIAEDDASKYEKEILGDFPSRDCRNILYDIEKNCVDESNGFTRRSAIPVASYSYLCKGQPVSAEVECTVINTKLLSSVERSWANVNYNVAQESLEKC